MIPRSLRSLAACARVARAAVRNHGRTRRARHDGGAAKDRPRARGRRSERRCAHRSASGSRGAARSRRLRRRHEHGRARRCDVRDGHASGRDRERGACDRLGADRRRPGPARPHADQTQARDDDLHASARGRDEPRRATHAGRAHRHAGDRAVHPHARRAVPLHAELRRLADSVSCRRNGHGRGRGRGPRQRRSRPGHAREHGVAGRLLARDARRQGAVRRRHDAQLAGRHRRASSARTWSSQSGCRRRRPRRLASRRR